MLNSRDINILIADDNPGDSFYVEELLKICRPGFGKVEVTNSLEKTYLALNKSSFNILILDIFLSDSDGTDTFSVLHKSYPQLPILIFAGQANSGLALECVKLGAQDYLVKGEFNEWLLEKTIIYCIERLQKDEAIRLSEINYKNLFEDSPVPLLAYNYATFNVIMVNQPACDLYGYSRAEFQGLNIVDMHPENEKNDIRNRIDKIAKGKLNPEKMDWRQKRKDGTLFWAEISGRFIFLNDQRARLIMVNDVSKRIENEIRMRTIIESSLDAIIMMDDAGIITGWNAQAEVIFKYTKEEALGRSMKETVIPPRYRKAHDDGLNHFHRTGHGPILGQRIEITAIRKSGEEFPIEISVSQINTSTGIFFSAFVRDLSEIKNAQARIRSDQQNLNSLINTTSDEIWSFDTNYCLLSFNEAYKDSVKSKYGMEAVSGASVLGEGQSKRKIFWILLYDRALTGVQIREETYYNNPDGTITYYEIRINPILDDAGLVKGVACFATDITERHHFQAKIKEELERYETLTLATNDAVWDWNIITDHIKWNKNIETLFGYSISVAESIPGMKWMSSCLHPEDVQRVSNEFNALTRSKSDIWSSYFRLKCNDASYKYVHNRAYIFYTDSLPVRLIGAIQDVNELTENRIGLERKVEERTLELRKALDKEKELMEVKNKFVSMVSHEFRTPLAAISMTGEFLSRYKDRLTDEQLIQKTQVIEKQVAHMTHLLDDILTIGKSEAGRIKVHRTRFSASEFFSNLVHEVEVATNHTHQINVTMNFLHDQIMLDEKLLRNILINLLTNAIKFSFGKSSVDLGLAGEAGKLIIEVRDYGIGIEETDLKNLFVAFSRGTNVGTIQGTGLGLSIIKKAMDLLDGKIEVTSTIGEGTRFKLTFPVEYAG